MSYIEREALLEHKRKMKGFDLSIEYWSEAVLCEDIRNAPTADVVEVVRCKDCVNYYQYEHSPFGVCDRKVDVPIVVYPNHFCSYGERKEE